MISTALAVLLYFVLPGWIEVATRLLIAFDFGALVFLAALGVMMDRSTSESMRIRARIEEEGRHTVLVLSVAVAVAILLAIVFELHGAKGVSPEHQAIHVALAIATILLSWIFMNIMFALHYANGYYGDADASRAHPAGGLVFPGGGKPNYVDFLYFSFVIGMTFQVSDVQIETTPMRKVALVHGVLGFFFNVVVVALTINIVAGMI